MPQLKSGRHVAASASPIMGIIQHGSDNDVSAAIMAFRLSVHSAEELRDHLTVGYFRENEGTPPNAPSYDSGFSIKDILEGKSDWSEEEVSEYRTWLETNENFKQWLLKQYEEIDSAIKKHKVWSSALWTEE